MAPADTDLAHDAERLIRSLAGVAHVRVSTTAHGIDSIDVTASGDDDARDLARLVRSALLAGLATPVNPTRVHVTVADPTGADTGDDAPRDRIRLIQQAGEARRARDAGDAPDRGGPAERDERARPEETDTGEAVTTMAAPAHAEPRPVQRPRLVAVDIDRTDDGRVACRVSVALHHDVHRAEATAVDLPGAAAQAAAQAAVRSLVDAGLHGLELGGLREVEIAGRDYVVVALKHGARHRSGSAPVIGSAERSAAEATVAAARELT